jgi:hypothetical protein
MGEKLEVVVRNGRNTDRRGHPALALLPFALGIFFL